MQSVFNMLCILLPNVEPLSFLWEEDLVIVLMANEADQSGLSFLDLDVWARAADCCNWHVWNQLMQSHDSGKNVWGTSELSVGPREFKAASPSAALEPAATAGWGWVPDACTGSLRASTNPKNEWGSGLNFSFLICEMRVGAWPHLHLQSLFFSSFMYRGSQNRQMLWLVLRNDCSFQNRKPVNRTAGDSSGLVLA